MIILYYEDNRTLNNSITGDLESQGHKVFSFYRKKDTLDWLEKNTPDLVILDIKEDEYINRMGENVPADEEAGFKIADKLKDKGLQIPIIFITGYANETAIRNKARKYGPIEFFDKGVKSVKDLDKSILDELLGKINRVVEFEKELSNLNKRFEKAFGKIISLERKTEIGSQYRVLPLKDIVSVKTISAPRTEPYYSYYEKSFYAQFRKVLKDELKAFIPCLPMTIEDCKEADKLKWLKPVELEKENYFTKEAKNYLNNCLLILKKVETRGIKKYYKLELGTEWLCNHINRPIQEIISKSKMSRLEKDHLNKFLNEWVEYLEETEDKKSQFMEIDEEVFSSIIQFYPNHKLIINNNNKKLYKNGKAQFLEFETNDKEKFIFYELNIKQFEYEERLLSSIIDKKESHSNFYLRLKDNQLINGYHISSFTEKELLLKNGTKIEILNANYHNLLKYFPTLRSKPKLPIEPKKF